MSSSSNEVENLSPVKRALLQIRELRAKLDAVEKAKREPIAVIGMGLRFPGEANNLETFWQLLHDGVDAIGDVPTGRWDVDHFYDPDPNAPGKMYVKSGGFLQNVDQFDPAFFGMSPREAINLDPQHRLLLEVSWEALENAGLVPDEWVDSQTGVFIGIGGSVDYARLIGDDINKIDGYSGTGTTFSAAAGRLSYIFGFKGPCMAVDTACSSSLVTLHLACQSLRNNESNMALVGGVSLGLRPESNINLSKARMLAPDGRCKTFDESADGFGRGEGSAAIVLKRLSDAVADGDNILAVIRGSAVNQDGRSSGLTAPNGPSQKAVIRQALANAGVAAHEIDYLEAHGTGTALGDPIEVQALAEVLGKDRLANNPLILGSVKTNIGHLEAAAGLAGVIKVVLSLQNNVIPPHLHFKTPSSHILWDEIPVSVATEKTPWPDSDGGRLAGVSSFGFSGVNAHVVVGDPPVLEDEAVDAKRPFHLLTLSAKTENALQDQLNQYANYLQNNKQDSFADISFTTNRGRSHFEHRLVLSAATAEDAYEQLMAHASGTSVVGLSAGQVDASQKLMPAFLFTGQGSQYVGMGRLLFETEPAFRNVLDECDALLRPFLDKSLLSVFYPENEKSPIDETAYTQPALFAIEYALAKLWQSWGIQPSVVMGHSVGEYVAACVAGVFSLEDGLKLIAERGRLMQALPRTGAMAAIFATESEVKDVVAPFSDQVSFAAVNGPENVVISGLETAVSDILNTLNEQGIKTRQLTVSHAFHSHLMDPMLDEFEAVADTVTFSEPQIDLISNVTGKFVAPGEITNAGYWRRHVREAVQFAAAIDTLHQNGTELFLEIGPNPTLTGMGQRSLPKGTGTWLYSLRNGRNDWQQILNSLGQLYVLGAKINWAAFNPADGRRRVSLPTYPFQRKRYWPEVTISSQQHSTAPVSKAAETPLAELNKWLYEIEWQAQPLADVKPASAQPGQWLVLADDSGVGETLAQRLQTQGETCLIVRPHAFAQTHMADHFIDPANSADFREMLQVVVGDGKRPLRGIVHMWGLDSAESSMAELEQAQVLGSTAALHLLQAMIAVEPRLSKQQKNDLPRLWLVTRSAQPLGNDPIALAQSPLWGLGKTIAIERQKLWGGLIDLAPNSQPEPTADALVAELMQPDGEQQIAFRDGQRFAARLVQSSIDLTNAKPVQLNTEASYLITGGFGALGLRVAKWMAEQGAKSLILLGRTPLPPREMWGEENGRFTHPIQLISDLEAKGVRVHFDAVDVANEVQLSEFMSTTERLEIPPIRGVIHAAGVLQDQALQNLKVDMLHSVMRPKMNGSWLLHHVLKDADLDFFTMFSSAASLGGSAGQSNYAAANAFMDALAHHRNQQGLPAQSINWGPWGEVGMAAETQAAKQAARRSVPTISLQQGLELFGHILNQNVNQIGVMPATLTQMRLLLPENTTFITPEITQQAAVSSDQTKSTIIERLRVASSEERQDLMLAFLRELVSQAMMVPIDEVATDLNVMEIGLDSIMVMELVTKLDKALQINLFPREIFERPSIVALAEYLISQVQDAGLLAVSTIASTTQAATQVVPAPGANGLAKRPTPLPELPEKRNSGMIFLLSGPRSGSTLLRVMLAGHPDLFSPPELHLLAFNDMAERNPNLDRSYLAEGLQRALMELTGLDADDSAEMLAEWEEQNLSIQDVYGRLQKLAGSRTLVDKSPSYTTHIEILERAEMLFENPKYIHLVRHPYAMIESFTRNRMDKMLDLGAVEPTALAEQVWASTNSNAIDFLEEIDPERHHQVIYEELVTNPEKVMRDLCTFLEIPFNPALLTPYEGDRMTDGVHAQSKSTGDPNLLKHKGIDPTLADAWKRVQLPQRLGGFARRVAKEVGYDLPWPLEPVQKEVKKPTAIVPISRDGELPLSFSQQRMWFLNQLDPDSPAYNMPTGAFHLKGALDVAVLEQSLNEIIRRHEVLRTSFGITDGQPVQVIHPALELQIPVVDLMALPKVERETKVRQLAIEEIQRPFDLSELPLLRTKLLKVDEDEHVFLMVMHHIVSDGWSVRVMLAELTKLYRAYVAGQASPLADVSIQYVDYASWQRDYFSGDVLNSELAFWKQHLAGAPEMLNLPTDHQRPEQQTFRGDRYAKMLPVSLMQSVDALSRAQGTTPFMTMLAALKIALYKWTDQDDMVLGTVVANRNKAESKEMVGCFINFLPIRSKLANEETGLQLLEQIKTNALDAFAHQGSPFEKVVEAIATNRNFSQNPLYNVAFLHQNLPQPSNFGEGLNANFVPMFLPTSNLDLRIVAQELKEGTYLWCEFNTDLFDAATIEQLVLLYIDTLEKFVDQPETKIAQFKLSEALVQQVEASQTQAPEQTIAVTATFTAEPVEDSLAFWMGHLQRRSRIEFAPYNQVFQQLLDPSSLLRQNQSGVNVVLVRFEDWQRFANGSSDSFNQEIERNVDDLVAALKTAVSKTPTILITCPASPALENDPEKAAFLARMESNFFAQIESNANLHAFTAADVLAAYPVTTIADLYSDEIGHIPYTTEFFTALGSFLARKIDLMQRKPTKVIALDCDNTLWQGVVGEDGVDGIMITPAHQKLHRMMAEQLEAGRLVCLLSKNQEADVREVFAQRDDMLLEWEQLTAVSINWQPKPQNIQQLADELQLGLDSFVFIDDNPVECAAMQAHCPEVLTLQMPTDEESIPDFLDHVWAFDSLKLTAEDKKRADFYQQNVKREQVRRQSTAFVDFLSQLEMKINVGHPQPAQLARVAQLTQRTNQFNATTIRRQIGDIQQLIDSDDHVCLIAEVSDRFGDYGLVSVIIYKKEADKFAVDTLLLSCRAMGRGVEHEILRHVALDAAAAGITQITVPYLPTARNQPALDFLESIEVGEKQEEGEGALFVYPVTAVTNLSYRPEFNDGADEVDEQAAESESATQTTAPAAPSERTQQIAAELSDVAQILQAVELSARRQRPESAQPYTAPQSETETSLAEIWGTLLGLEQVSIHDNFFELGGHSLLATRLLARLHENMQVDLSLREFFETPTIATLAAQIETIRWLNQKPDVTEIDESDEREEFEI